jgi:GT2 family glycosyltransferase
MTGRRVAVITAARNEAAKIARAIESVVAQEHRPDRWVIASDGSTDETDKIVASYCDQHPWIQLVQVSGITKRDFASKVHALKAAVGAMGEITEDYFGVLDADIVLEPEHFRVLLEEFEGDARLGLVGAQIWEEYDGKRVLLDTTKDTVPGAVQLFRREAYEGTSGFHPLPSGGEDTLAELEVRMAGWDTRTIGHLQVTHIGRVVSGGRGSLSIRYRRGRNQWLFGYGLVFACMTSVYRMRERPLILGGLVQFAAYLWAALRRPKRPVSKNLMKWLRREQRAKMRALLTRADIAR